MAMKKLLIASLLFGSSITAYGAEPFVVEDIRFEGLQRVTLGAALLQIPVRIGDQVEDQDAAEIIRRLFDSGNYEDVKVLRDGGQLIVRVKERPTIASISFSGNSTMKDEQLSENLSASSIRVGEALDRTTLNEIEKALEDFYYSVGKYSASVQAVVTPLPRNRADLRFVFTEGVSAKIEQINFIGNSVFSDEELAKSFSLRSDIPWWNFFANDQYQKQALAGDIEKLRTRYLNEGYLKFRVESTNVSISPDKKGVYITLKVDEGLPYTINSVSYRSADASGGHHFAALADFAIGDTYNGAKITQLEEAINQKLAESGYAYPQVQTFPDFDDENQHVDLVVNIDPGQRMYVRNIEFSGNTSTKDEVLRREMRQMEGSWLNSASIERGRERLNRTGFFENVDVRTNRVPGSDDLVDVEYVVREANAGNINFGVGYGTESGVSFQAGIEQDNFMGTGNRFGINAMMNDYQKNISLEYRNPYFTLDGVSLGGKIYYDEFEASDANIVDYTNQSYGATLTWGFPFDELNFIEFGVGYTHNKISNLDAYLQVERFLKVQEPNIDPEDNSLNVNDFDWSISWTRNNLNRGYFPTAGNYQSAYVKMTVPGSDVQFYKSQYEVRQYFPVTQGHEFSLLLRGRLGYGNGYGSIDGNDHLLPFYENFYAGGFSTLRGFRSNTAGPKAVYDGNTNCVGGDGSVIGSNQCLTGTDKSVGGNGMALASVELFVPTPFASDEARNQLRTSVFLDVASIWDTEFDLSGKSIGSGDKYIYDYSDPTNFRASVGAALQWWSPMGPLVFSLATPLKKYEGDRDEVFTFTIGRTF
ncbi:outer membrane protein assembly factor BamA [Thaumasiovibrio sp. DFM-14]|uniref:outer membrane protein assembly factor BamA n=1 Tax=Thaumasiovibrio sp. DFM-14 TaxID=3384792 RepID=UPI0039A22641